jgi:hypothetical protein
MMDLLLADTMLFDRVLEDALRVLDQLREMAHVTDLGCDPFEWEVDDRPDAATVGPGPLAWPHHQVIIR